MSKHLLANDWCSQRSHRSAFLPGLFLKQICRIYADIDKLPPWLQMACELFDKPGIAVRAAALAPDIRIDYVIIE
jgi:hypothetical protein